MELHVTATLFACIIEMFFIMLVLVIWKFRVQGKRRKNILLLITIPVYQLALLGCMFYMCSDFSREVLGAGMLIVLFSLLLDWLTAGLIDGQNLRAEMEEQVNRLNEERRKELEYSAQNSRYLEEVRLMRHDFSNQLQLVDSLYAQDGCGQNHSFSHTSISPASLPVSREGRTPRSRRGEWPFILV